MAMRDGRELADGSRMAAEITASMPVPKPMNAWTAPDIARLAKYCTCAE
jgi:hypothetical protein